MNSDVEGIKQL